MPALLPQHRDIHSQAQTHTGYMYTHDHTQAHTHMSPHIYITYAYTLHVYIHTYSHRHTCHACKHTSTQTTHACTYTLHKACGSVVPASTHFQAHCCVPAGLHLVKSGSVILFSKEALLHVSYDKHTALHL